MARRDRSKEEFWRRMIGRQARSGQSVRAWCGRHGVSAASFYWWRRRLGRSGQAAQKSGPRRTARPRFVAVRVAADQAGATSGRANCIEILLGDKRRVRVFGAVDRQALADVLGVLRSADADASRVVHGEVAAC